MKKILLSLCFSLAMAANTWGHGFSVKLINNEIVPSPGSNTVNGIQQLFVEDVTGNPPDYNYFSASHGAVSGMTAVNGFTVPGSSLQINFNGGLWFSDGSGAAAVPANPDVVMEVFKVFGSPLAAIDGSSGAQAGFGVSGTNSHELTWSLKLVPGATLTQVPAGVYGWSYTIGGTGPGGPFDPSKPLVVAFATDNFTSPNGLTDEYLQVFAAAVPEPTSAILALTAAAFAIRGWRGRRHANQSK